MSGYPSYRALGRVSQSNPSQSKTASEDHRSLQLCRFGLGGGEDKLGMVVVSNVWTKEMAATMEGGHFDSALCGCLYFHWRFMTRNTLPLSVRHLHPCISPALMSIERLSRRIGALCFEDSRRDGRMAKCRYFHIFVLGAVIFGRFRCCQRLGLAGDFPIAPRTNELVGQQRGD